MKHTRIHIVRLATSVLLGFILMIVPIIPLSQKAVAQTPVTLSIVPATQTVTANSQVTLSVNISNPSSMSITAADLTINFDSTKLTNGTITAGSYLTTVLLPGRVSNGKATITLGSTTTPVTATTGTLATLRFTVVGSSSVAFDPSSAVAASGFNSDVASIKSGASITVAGVPTPTPVTHNVCQVVACTNAVPPVCAYRCTAVSGTGTNQCQTVGTSCAPSPSPTSRPISLTPTRIPPVCARRNQGDSVGPNNTCDGVIDGVDYSRWLNTQCVPGAGQFCSSLVADFNQDGRVDDTDYKIWLQYRNT